MRTFLFRVRMTSSGADTPRLVVLRRKESGSEWFVWEYPGIVSGIRVPKAENPLGHKLNGFDDFHSTT